MPVISTIILIFILGLLLGSFASAIAYRIPHGVSWVHARSSCPSCQTKLSFFDLIPVISWCFSRGRCRHCNAPISIRYPLLEIVSGILCAGLYLQIGLTPELFFTIAIVPVLLALFLIDFKYLILPDQLVLILFLVGLLRLAFFAVQSHGVPLSGLAYEFVGGAVIYAALSWGLGTVMTKILKKESLGFGDVKFFSAAGIWLGISALPYFLILSGGLGIGFALVWRLITGQERFPLGPALIIALYIIIIVQGGFAI